MPFPSVLRLTASILLVLGALAGPALPAAAASGRVEIIADTAMGPDLAPRPIRVYLPPGYDAAPDRRWPVVYLHDGQNLFDDRTAYAGEWQVDETIDRLVREGVRAGWIVVGIDNGGEARMSEYAPWPFAEAPVAKGAAHAAAVAEMVKPMIDARFRTDPRAEATLIGGSSMGAVISVYTALRYPDRFGGVLAMSGSWVEDWMMADLRRWLATLPAPPAHLRVYLDMGAREWGWFGASAKQARSVEEALRTLGLPPERLRLVIDPDGKHREADWARRLPDALLWLSAE
ncbi:MAG: hypothetical protein RLY86_2341 [Pseudomonadota bacterium]|jgi:predicted alpha/beta superfamily hydrolase